MPEARLIQARWRGSIERRNNPMPRLNPSHHTNDPTHTPSTRNPARTSVACVPPRPSAAKIARKTRIVTGLVMVSAKAETKSRNRVSGLDCSAILSRSLGHQGGAADIEQINAAGGAQPSFVAEKPVGNESEAKGGDGPEQRVGGCGAEPRYQSRQPAIENRPVQAQDADRADRNRDHRADHDALQKKHQKHRRAARAETTAQSPGTAEAAQCEMRRLSRGATRAMLTGRPDPCRTEVADDRRR